jgi:hypothetical protein
VIWALYGIDKRLCGHQRCSGRFVEEIKGCVDTRGVLGALWKR